MKAFDEPRDALASRAGLILLFDGEVGLRSKTGILLFRDEGHDEHHQTDILTSGLSPRSRLPGLEDQWLWESVTRYSGATVSDFHGVP